MVSSTIKEVLQEIDPDSEFDFSLPLVSSSSGKRYFAKTGSSSEKEQFTGEAESLKHIYAAAPGLAPKVLAHGVDESGRPYFVSDYLDMTSHSGATMDKLATRLAGEMHVYTSDKGFGFDVPTFCGATRMENGWFEVTTCCFKDSCLKLKACIQTWEECYDALIGGLHTGLARRSGRGNLVEKIAKVREMYAYSGVAEY